MLLHFTGDVANHMYYKTIREVFFGLNIWTYYIIPIPWNVDGNKYYDYASNDCSFCS